MAKRSRPIFPGSLNEPILKSMIFPLGKLPETTEKERNTAYQKRLKDLRLHKLIELLKYYKIVPPEKYPWFVLAYRLACDFVPGMQVVDSLPRRARPREHWGLELAHRFCDEIDAIRTERPGTSVVVAIKILRDRNPVDWGKYKVPTLETRYYELKRERRTRRAMPPLGLLGDFFIKTGKP
jgi:hypothetical protein